jgi:ubiquinone/menaquinone biosynthesis C-methylase UbiE
MASTSPAALSTVPGAARVVATNEKVTGPAGLAMLQRSLDAPHSEPLTVLDNATGGGVLVSQLLYLAEMDPKSMKIDKITAADNDERMLNYTRQRSQESKWSNVEVVNADQTSLPFEDKSFDFVFSNFGIFFHPNDEKTLSETYRTLKSGGTAGFTSWKSIAWWPAVAIPAIQKYIPDAPALPPNVNIFPAKGWTEAETIPPKLEAAGFQQVRVEEYAFTPEVEAEEFAEATAVLVRVVMQRLWKAEDVEKFGGKVEEVLLRYLKENWKDGKWDGKMVALATTGRKA